MTKENEKPKPEQDKGTGRFVSGNIGGGRPKGSRNKLGEAFLSDLYADWEQHGPRVIEAVRAEKPDVYMKVIASILPKDLNVNINPLEQASDEELVERLKDLESVIRPFIDPAGSNPDQKRADSETAH